MLVPLRQPTTSPCHCSRQYSDCRPSWTAGSNLALSPASSLTFSGLSGCGVPRRAARYWLPNRPCPSRPLHYIAGKPPKSMTAMNEDAGEAAKARQSEREGRHQFQAEVAELLNLMVHSVY